jgi:arginyl-tRNA synthetase
MPNALDNIKRRIAKELSLDNPSFSYPPSQELGDLSLACFSLAKERKQAPAELAVSLAATLSAKKRLKRYFLEIKAVGPYLNFFINPAYLAEKIITIVAREKGKYGTSGRGRGRKVMIEYSNGNTHKEVHIGHLRNIAYGDAVNRILSANGFHSLPVSYINDFGIHTAKTIWNWRRHPEYAASQEGRGFLLGKCYSQASQELKDHPEYKEEVSAVMKDIEARRGENYELWKETREWSLRYFSNIYRELGIRFKHTFYENEVIDAGLAFVKQLLAAGKLVKSEGAIIADLSQYDLGVLPIIRTDGTALYPVADLALAKEKFDKYGIQESLYVVDVRQSLYFKQLFQICHLLGYRQEMRHLTYDFVALPEGMMASRTGNVITYEELKEKVWQKLIEETKKRHEDWTGDRVRQAAFSLAISTIKFEMLKVGADKVIIFNIEEALRFDGYTACYLQYGYARLKSIIRKEKPALFPKAFNQALLQETKEKALLLKIAAFPEVLAAASDKYNPAEVAKYLFELVQMSNDYYHSFPILKAEPKLRRARLALVKALARTLNNGFNLLGLHVIEEM